MAFPSDFVWGVSTAAFQIEGAPAEGGRTPSVWDALTNRPGAIFENHNAAVACDHYHRYPEDIALMADLGVQAYRLSLAWPRILPAGEGPPNHAGLEFYDRLIDALLARNIQPWITLFHWDLPLELHHRGGWLNRDSADWFANYTTAVVQRLGDRVHHWMTFNEPQIFLHAGHQVGVHAPGLRLDIPDLVRATHHVLLAHGRAVAAIREHSPTAAQVGWALTGLYPHPASADDADIAAARQLFATATRDDFLSSTTWFAEPTLRGEYPSDALDELGQHLPADWQRDLAEVQQPLDFIGVNSYQGRPTRAGENGQPEIVARTPGYAQTMAHWPVDPAALEWGTRFMYERYQLPIYITENGCACMDWIHADGHVHDTPRIDFLTRYLAGLRNAIDDGADVRGYFHWSLMDNFEWSLGYQMRFGLVYVDCATLARTPKDSFAWYKAVIQTNGDNLPAKLDWHY